MAWIRAGNVTAKEMAENLNKVGFAAICLEWERPFLEPLYAWSSAIQGRQGPMTLAAMLKVLFSWLAARLERGDRLQRLPQT